MSRAMILGLIATFCTAALVRGEPPCDAGGDVLPPGARARLGAARWRHGSGVQEVVYSSDGKLLASRGRDRAVRVWDADSGKPLRQFQTPDTEYYALAFSPDSAILAAAAGDCRRGGNHRVHLWSITSGAEIRTLTGPLHPIFNLTFAPDGRSLYGVGLAETRVWDVASGRPVERWDSSALFVGGKPVCIASDGAGVSLRTPDGEVVARLTGLTQEPQAAAVSTDGALLAAANPYEPIRIFNLAAGTTRVLADASAGVAVAFSPDKALLATANAGGVVRLWNVRTGLAVRELHGYRGWSHGLAFSPDGKSLALAGADSPTVRIWDVATGAARGLSDGHTGPIFRLAVSPDGKLLASGGTDTNDAALRLWNLTTGAEVREVPRIHGSILDLAFSPDGSVLAVTSDKAPHVECWKIEAGQVKRRMELGRDQRPTALAFAPAGSLLAAGTTSGPVHLFDLATSKPLRELRGHESRVTGVVFSPDGKHIASASQDRTVRLWKMDGGLELLRLDDFPDSIVGLAYSPDGTTLAVGTSDTSGNIHLIDAGTGRRKRRLGEGPTRVRGLAFSPDGSTIVAAHGDRSVCIWEVASGLKRRCYCGHQGEVHAVALSADGQAVISAGKDTSILLWKMSAPLCKLLPLTELWRDLASDDGSRGDQAVWQLVRRPREAVPFLEERFSGAGPPTTDKVVELVRRLDDDDFAVRERAARELTRHGELLAAELSKQLEQAASLETRRRLELILRRAQSCAFDPDRVRAARVLEVLGRIGGEEVIAVRRHCLEVRSGPTQEIQAVLELLSARQRRNGL